MEPRNTRNTQKEFLLKEKSYLIRGAVFEIYREMGCGFLVTFGHYPKATIERVVT